MRIHRESVRRFPIVFGTMFGSVWLFGTAPSALGQCDPIWVNIRPNGLNPGPRSQHGLVFDAARSRAVLFGGNVNGADRRGDTWAWDGAAWTLIATTGPTARESFGMAYDVVASEIVLQGGGTTTEISSETWTLAGDVWHFETSFGPGPLVYQAMAAMPGGGVVMFGGTPNGATRTNLTWAWNGSAWTQVTGIAPPAREACGLAASGTTVELFGGLLNSGTDVTPWRFDEPNWTPLASSPTAGNWYLCWAFDSTQNLFVSFGGTPNGIIRSNETWTWDGTSWQLLTGLAPSPRERSGACDFPPMGGLLLYGGDTTGGIVADMWLLTARPAVVSQPTSIDACPGRKTEIALNAGGNGPIAYQWQRERGTSFADIDDGPSSTGSTISGSRTSILTIATVGTGDAGRYRAILRNDCGQIISVPIVVVVRPCPPCAADFDESGGTPDSGDIDEFFSAWLVGELCADVDCSGGTPDAGDIDEFFGEWLAGGC